MELHLEDFVFPEEIADGYYISDIKDTEDELIVEFRTSKHSCRCPNCGQESAYVQTTHVRTIQDLPLSNKKVTLKVHVNDYVCFNEDCPTTLFQDQLDFVRKNGTRTYRLNTLILAVSMFLSNRSASRVLKELGVKVSADSIRRIYDRLIFEDDSDIEEIGIDDVALRKGNVNYIILLGRF